MKIKNILLAGMTCLLALGFTSCKDDPDTDTPQAPDFSGTYLQRDQMARPAINTVFVDAADKNTFNTTPPSAQGAAFQSKFQAKLNGLNAFAGGAYTTNLLTFTDVQFTTALATDVLTVDLDGVTSFFNGTQVLTGRALNDDVITTELILIFGGPTGGDNPALTDDNVDQNDKAFDVAFPYVASPHL